MADVSMEKVFADIMKQCQSIVAKSVKTAAKKVHKEIIKESYRQLAKYYANYKPKKYKRTKMLHKAITPVFAKSLDGDNTIFEIGVEYDSNKLKGFYKSNSWYHQSGTEWISRSDPYFDFDSQNNGIPQPEWIMNNFIEGRHIWGNPETFGPQVTGKHSWGQIDAESPRSLMEDFFDTQLPEHINRYVSEEITRNLIRELKNYGG